MQKLTDWRLLANIGSELENGVGEQSGAFVDDSRQQELRMDRPLTSHVFGNGCGGYTAHMESIIRGTTSRRGIGEGSHQITDKILHTQQFLPLHTPIHNMPYRYGLRQAAYKEITVSSKHVDEEQRVEQDKSKRATLRRALILTLRKHGAVTTPELLQQFQSIYLSQQCTVSSNKARHAAVAVSVEADPRILSEWRIS